MSCSCAAAGPVASQGNASSVSRRVATGTSLFIDERLTGELRSFVQGVSTAVAGTAGQYRPWVDAAPGRGRHHARPRQRPRPVVGTSMDPIPENAFKKRHSRPPSREEGRRPGRSWRGCTGAAGGPGGESGGESGCERGAGGELGASWGRAGMVISAPGLEFGPPPPIISSQPG